MGSPVADAPPAGLLQVEVDFCKVVGAHADLGVRGGDVHVLERAHEVVKEPLAVHAEHVHHAVCGRCAAVDHHLPQKRRFQ